MPSCYASAGTRPGVPAAAVPGEQPSFVALVPYHGIGAAADRASIRDARTGQVTALVPQVPGIPRFRAVTAAADGLFYLIAGLPVRDGRAVTFDTRVFRLAVDSEGQVAELTALPEDLLPPGTRHVAVTPDGSHLVYVTGELSSAGWLTAATATVGTATGQRRSYPAAHIGGSRAFSSAGPRGHPGLRSLPPRGLAADLVEQPAGAADKEVHRRTGVVGTFPGREAIIRLVGAVLAEQDDEWTESRRYMGLEILAACRKAAEPGVVQNGTSETGLTIEAIPPK